MTGKVLCRRSEASLRLHRLCLCESLQEKDEGGELPTEATEPFYPGGIIGPAHSPEQSSRRTLMSTRPSSSIGHT